VLTTGLFQQSENGSAQLKKRAPLRHHVVALHRLTLRWQSCGFSRSDQLIIREDCPDELRQSAPFIQAFIESFIFYGLGYSWRSRLYID
jgi:hypothetical protein